MLQHFTVGTNPEGEISKYHEKGCSLKVDGSMPVTCEPNSQMSRARR